MTELGKDHRVAWVGLGEDVEDVDERHGVPAHRTVPDLERVSAVGGGPGSDARVVVSVIKRLGGVGRGGILECVLPLKLELERDIGCKGVVSE